ncbi:D-alanyl-D-alanine carboxypeptidase/D-alanyl-D-alanine-endopeptidase [Planococcus salinus]|uniref:D-alanyl-D-alanine carboxypeptidase/D-alanyl-D-alanine-endopeptidase n=1 Tax=Planococcus salinus TaxID=1848460 RepID=A0A3M8P9H8_9BACL|nr:D-alanyl-D-alanine carboxypeptidase/D-alanyl-D-alanine-endopeptidase [Planococcus salinus]RNF40303.1 D-alanyl-D-alanine carboxypeptidase/D-alanyl-D-alanine-endopeptidase [Planococcus salinus]
MEKLKRKIVCLIVLVMLLGMSGFSSSAVEAASPYQPLQHSINKILTDSRMAGTTSSITIRNAETGEAIYEKNADQLVTPASTLKVLTAAAALETLGENHRFSTELYTDGTVAKGTLYGNLYLRGKGDPTVLKKDFDNFASILYKRGVKRLAGHIIGDDTWYDAERLSPGISREDESYYYAAQISALNLSPNTDYDAGSVIVDAKPSVLWRPADITLTPATGIVRVINRSKTVPRGYANTLKIEREYGTHKIIISGHVPIGSIGKKEWIAVSNPTKYAIDVFKKSLAERGIRFVPTSKIAEGVTPENARLLLSKQSMPLKNLVVPFMKLSNNTHAEILAKEMGKAVYGEGSWDAGLQVMTDYASSIGLDTGHWSFEDASGMSHANKVSSSQMSQLLYAVRSEPWHQTFLTGLPVAGADKRFVGGTLRYRLTGGAGKGNVLAKTGNLEKVSSLSGYAKTQDGEWLVFTVLTQDYRYSTLPVIDRVAQTIAASSKKP